MSGKIKRLMGVFNYADVNDKRYFYARKDYGICVYDKKTQQLDCLPREKEERELASYSDVMHYKNSLFFAPYFSKKILKYDLSSQSKEYVSFDHDLRSNKVLVIKDKLYFFSNALPEVVEYDPLTGNSSKIDLPQIITMCAQTYDSSTRVYACTGEEDVVLEIDVENGSMKRIPLKPFHCKYATICYDGSSFWLSGSSNFLVKWNPNDDFCEQIILPEQVTLREQKNGTGDYFSSAVVLGKSVFFAPRECVSVVRVDLETNAPDEIFRIEKDLKTVNIQLWDGNSVFICAEDSNYDVAMACAIDRNGQVLKNNIFEYESIRSISEESTRVGLSEFIHSLREV